METEALAEDGEVCAISMRSDPGSSAVRLSVVLIAPEDVSKVVKNTKDLQRNLKEATKTNSVHRSTLKKIERLSK